MTTLAPEDRRFLKEFYRNVMDVPLSPDDPRYIPLYDESHGLLGDDPIALLEQTIDFCDDSVQLLGKEATRGATFSQSGNCLHGAFDFCSKL